jgi:hypothetical protein
MNLISTKVNTNQRMGVHGPLNISEVGSGAMEEYIVRIISQNELAFVCDVNDLWFLSE